MNQINSRRFYVGEQPSINSLHEDHMYSLWKFLDCSSLLAFSSTSRKFYAFAKNSGYFPENRSKTTTVNIICTITYTDKLSSHTEKYFYHDGAMWAEYTKNETETIQEKFCNIDEKSYSNKEVFKKVCTMAIDCRMSIIKEVLKHEGALETGIFDELVAKVTLQKNQENHQYGGLAETIYKVKRNLDDGIPLGNESDLFSWSLKDTTGSTVYSEKIKFTDGIRWPTVNIWAEYSNGPSEHPHSELIGKLDLTSIDTFRELSRAITQDICEKRVNDINETLTRLRPFNLTNDEYLDSRQFKKLKETVLLERKYEEELTYVRSVAKYLLPSMTHTDRRNMNYQDGFPKPVMETSRFHFTTNGLMLEDRVLLRKSGVVRAEYTDPQYGLKHNVHVCRLFTPNTEQEKTDAKDALEKIADARYKTIEQSLDNLKKPLEDPDFNVSYKVHQQSLKLLHSVKINGYICTIERRMQYDYLIELNVFNSEMTDKKHWSEHISKQIGDQEIIVDTEIPYEATLVRLLLINPYSKIPYPGLNHILNELHESRCNRRRFIDSFSNNSTYELRYKGVLVVKKDNENTKIFNETLFNKLTKTLTFEEQLNLFQTVITKDYIERAVNEGYIPATHAYKLERDHLNKTIEEAYLSTNLYGNIRRQIDIQDEIRDLSTEDKKLYGAVESLYKDEPNDLAETLFGGRDALRTLPTERPETYRRIHNLISYLKGKIEELEITPETGVEYLKLCKMADYAAASYNCVRRNKQKHSTYLIRVKIAEVCPNITSIEAFSRKFKVEKLGDIPQKDWWKHWEPQRSGLQGHAIVGQYVPALEHSKNISEITGSRGNTGVGKSSHLGNAPGILNTDHVKFSLRKKTQIRNKQIHNEGSLLFSRLFNEIDFLFTIDKRLSNWVRLRKYLINPAIEKNCPAKIIDIDAPLIVSLMRVLTRDPHGKDPCPTLDAIIDGFRSIREHRATIIDAVLVEDVVTEYKLFTHKKTKIAVKKDDDYNVFDDSKLAESLRVPTDEEIDKTLNRTIDDTLIDEAVREKYIYDTQKNQLEAWKGKSLSEAIKEQAEK